MERKLGCGQPPQETWFEANFGFYDLTIPLEREFMMSVRDRSSPVRCADCGSEVLLLPGKGRCAICAFNVEMGWPIERLK